MSKFQVLKHLQIQKNIFFILKYGIDKIKKNLVFRINRKSSKKGFSEPVFVHEYYNVQL